VVAALKAPIKTKPADPGGSEVPHQDNKFLNKLDDAALPAPTPAAPAAASSDGAPRKVATIAIGPDRTAVATPPPGPPPTIPAVPG
ncbi:MAG TPA: SPOR domain-containing protein, partial [Hyphomicrobiaceae bacterium]|nr:SPOR domain-containing protein [Hyphomicrobiaceae bacterium]